MMVGLSARQDHLIKLLYIQQDIVVHRRATIPQFQITLILSSPRAQRAGPKGPRAESARAVTGT